MPDRKCFPLPAPRLAEDIYVYICMCMCMYIYVYMKSSFPKHVKRQSKNRCCNANAKFGDHVLKPFINMYACTHIYMSKALYRNTIFEPGIGISSSFSGMSLNAFWKRALHMYIKCECGNHDFAQKLFISPKPIS